ncbi:CD320 antigen [Spheniscus humboldti]
MPWLGRPAAATRFPDAERCSPVPPQWRQVTWGRAAVTCPSPCATLVVPGAARPAARGAGRSRRSGEDPAAPPRLLTLRPSPAASLAGCPSGQFQCGPGATCFPWEWRCDGHPDCEDEGDEWGCGTATPAEPSPDGAWVTPPRSSAVLPTGGVETSATPVPGDSVPSRSQGRMWILIIAVLLSILVAVGSVAVWGLSEAKNRSDIFSLEKASREQLMPDKSQTGSFP